jgi:hypothetical protein
VTPTAKSEAGRWGTKLTPAQPAWVKVAFVVVVLLVAFVVAQTCQKSQIRLDKDQAITKAVQQVGFTPQRTQIRLLRQGLNSKPYWIVSLSRPGKRQGTFSELAVIKIDANTGKVASVEQQPPR